MNYSSMKSLTDDEIDWLMDAWEVRISQMRKADLEEVQQALEIMFMPFIKQYLKIYDADGGFSSLPSFGKRSLDPSVDWMPRTEIQEKAFERSSIADSPYSSVTREGSAGDDNAMNLSDDVQSSDWLDASVPTSPLQSPLGIDSLEDGQGEIVSERSVESFFNDAIAGSDYLLS